MKKFLKTILAGILSVATLFAFTGCGVELNFGKELVKYKSQLDALTQLDKGTVDVCVIDSTMANYYASNGIYKDTIAVLDNLNAEDEFYGIAGRKDDKALISKINTALIESDAYSEVIEDYGFTNIATITAETTDPLANSTDDSWSKIVTAKKIVIGYTVFAPIAYEDNGTLTGFDIDLAKKVMAYLDSEIEVEFKVIEWSEKETLLANGTIDLIWNAMTITEEREAQMCISVPYLKNKQVSVVKIADKDKYATIDAMADAIIGVEDGSAGEGVVVKAD